MSHQILDRQQVLKMVEDFTDDIISVVPNLSKSFVWNVIIKNKWNKLFIMDEIFDQKNEKILAQNHFNDNNNNRLTKQMDKVYCFLTVFSNNLFIDF